MVLCPKKKAYSEADILQQLGHVSLWVAFDPVSKLEICHRADAQTLDACRAFVKDLTNRLTNIPFYTTDELGHYRVVLFETYRIDPDITWDFYLYEERYRYVHPELDYAMFHKERCGGQVVSTKKIVLYGDEKRILEKIKGSQSKTINTSFIERYNGILRGLCANLARRSQCFSKSFKYFCSRISIVSVYYNFIRPHGTLSKRKGEKYYATTPAMAKGITDKVLDFKELLAIPYITTVV